MSHANKADKLLIKPTAGARPASPRTLGRLIRKTRDRGLTPEESQTARRHLAWQRPLTDRPTESHRRLSPAGLACNHADHRGGVAKARGGNLEPGSELWTTH